MITQCQQNRFDKKTFSVFQRINSLGAPKKENDHRPVRKVGFICEDENEQEARIGIVHLAATHAAKTGENVLNFFNPKEEAA